MKHDTAPHVVDEPIFTSEIQKFILIFSLTLSLIAGIWFLWSAHLSNREDEVHQAFVAAKTPEEKRQVADRNVGTQQAALIYLGLANAALDTKPQEALDLYSVFLAKYDHSPLVNVARLGKAKALESLQKPLEAIAVYQEVAQSKVGESSIPFALLNLSRLQLAQGQLAQARQNLQDLIARHPAYADEATERLKLIPESKS